MTCSVVVTTIISCGYNVRYYDIVRENLGPDVKDLSAKLKPDVGFIVIQHNFGLPAFSEQLVALLKEWDGKVIEDCCLTVGSKWGDFKVGNSFDFSIFSFDTSKPINALAGGMLRCNSYSDFKLCKFPRVIK